MFKAISFLSATALSLFVASGARAEVKLPAIFGDHMVLQQEAKLPVWGWADPGENSNWALLREAQFKALALPNTGLAVTLGLGLAGAVHPPDKADIGARLALAARHVAYGENLVYTGPIYDAMKVEGNKIRISFKTDSLGGGLIIGGAPWTDPKAPPVSKTDLQGFTIAGADQNWAWADAKIDGTNVVVSSPQVPSPVAVRYAWANNPVCNLYNKEGLPAAPFRTDDWVSPPSSTAATSPPPAPTPLPAAKTP